ncbi:hypothetical protein BGW80DRAFT_1564456 [Lactifluus volemus]|nr:hypothetical protein BGW80DRAFT_1564456 [Lactifluus volemus]
MCRFCRRPHGILYHVPRGSTRSSLALPEVRCVSQFPLASEKATYGGEGCNLLYTLRLDDLADLYGRFFGRILSYEGAKASPYSRYYVAVSTPHTWKYTMTALGGFLTRLGKLENGTTKTAPISVLSTPVRSR